MSKPSLKKQAANAKKSLAMEAFVQDALEEEAQQEEASSKAAASHDELISLSNELVHLKDEIDKKESELKQFKDRYDEIRKTLLPDMMKKLSLVTSNGKGSFTFSGGKIHLESRLYASCSGVGQPTFFKWLRKNGAADLIKETVNAQTLSAFIRERRGDGLKDPPGVSTHEEVVAKLTITR